MHLRSSYTQWCNWQLRLHPPWCQQAKTQYWITTDLRNNRVYALAPMQCINLAKKFSPWDWPQTLLCLPSCLPNAAQWSSPWAVLQPIEVQLPLGPSLIVSMCMIITLGGSNIYILYMCKSSLLLCSELLQCHICLDTERQSLLFEYLQLPACGLESLTV